MPRVKKLDLGMTALDELFMNDKERAENKLPKIFDIPLSEIDDFPDHPYRVLDDEDMQNLMESIRDRGVITPAMSETQWSVSVCCLCVLPQCRSMRTVRSTSRLRACATKYRRIIRFSVKLYLCFQKGRKIKMSLNIEK